jgi:hypothetical protein
MPLEDNFMTDLNLTASAPQAHSAAVRDPFQIIDDMVDLRIQMAQLEQQIRAACFLLDQAKIDRSRAIISRKLTPAQWTYTAEVLDQEILFKQLRKQFQQDHEPSGGRDITWMIRLLFTQPVGSPR